MELENRELCAKCGGRCCLEMGCYYSAEDLKVIDSRSIKEMLSEGYTSIKADILTSIPKKIMLSLKARNIGADVIDLVSYTRSCMVLGENGCKYSLDKRPSGGKYLIPNEKGMCDYSEISLLDIIESWLPYQKLLKSICEDISGRKYEELLAEKVEEFLYQSYKNESLANGEFDKFRRYFPKEHNKALKRAFDINMGDSLETKMTKMF